MIAVRVSTQRRSVTQRRGRGMLPRTSRVGLQRVASGARQQLPPCVVVALRVSAEQERSRVGTLALVLADSEQCAQEIRPQVWIRHEAMELGGSALEGGRVELERSEAAVEQFVVLESRTWRSSARGGAPGRRP